MSASRWPTPSRTCPTPSSSSTEQGTSCGGTTGRAAVERTLDDWRGKSGFDLMHPDDHESALRSLSTVGDKAVGAPIEIRVNAASGWRLIEMVGIATQWLGDNVVLLCLRDLTQRRRFELASGREARLRSVGAQRRVRHHAGRRTTASLNRSRAP